MLALIYALAQGFSNIMLGFPTGFVYLIVGRRLLARGRGQQRLDVLERMGPGAMIMSSR